MASGTVAGRDLEAPMLPAAQPCVLIAETEQETNTDSLE